MMDCYICFDRIRKTESSVKCSNHEVHAACLYLWHQTHNSDDNEQLKCLLCQGELQIATLRNFMADHQSILLSLADKGQIEEFVEFFEAEIVSYDFFIAIVKQSLKSNSLEVARYLKGREMVVFDKRIREKFVKDFYRIQSPNHIRWILGNFDDSFVEPLSHDLDEPMVTLFKSAGAYLELYWIYKDIFRSLTEADRIFVGAELFKSGQLGLWTQGYTGFTWMFHGLCMSNAHLSCYILSRIYPLVVRQGLFGDEYLPNGCFRSDTRFCANCQTGHMWDVVFFLLELNDHETLREFLKWGPFFPELPSLSYDELALLVSKTTFPLEAKALLERTYSFKKPYLWDAVFKRSMKPEKKSSIIRRLKQACKRVFLAKEPEISLKFADKT